MRVGMVFASPTPLVARFTRDGAKVADAHPERRTDGAWSLDAGPLLRVYGATGIEVELQPGQNLACVSAEYYRLPPDVEGQLFTKSSRAREWITHSTATLIHPGFCGEIAFELHYTGQHPYVIRNGMRLVQIAFSRLEAPVEAPYFARIGAHYRGQRGEVRSRDPEGLA
jgi:deoxycytidine triphosphate deaminase